MGKILLNNIAEELAAKGGITREAAASFLHAFFETIEKGLQADQMVKVKGLGTFKLQEVNDRDSVDVNTGERITIKGYRKVSFTPDSAMKEFVNRPFAHFEPTELNDGFPTDSEPIVPDSVDEADEPETFAEVTTEVAEPVESVEMAEHVESVATEPLSADSITEATELLEAPEDSDTSNTSNISEETFAEPIVKDLELSETSETLEISETPEESPVVVVEPITEDSSESVPSEDSELSEDADNAESSEKPESPKAATPKKAKKKRRGCGCFFVLLLVALVLAGAYLYWMSSIDETSMADSKDEHVDNGDIVVNPNLSDELGIEWGNKPEETPLPGEENLSTENSADTELISVTDTKEPPLQDTLSQQPIANSQQPVVDSKVVITESLSAKSVASITVADTTDYIIAGTFVAHKLKSGETIIQLSNKYYGDKRLWPYIVHHNQMKQYNSLAIGQMINIPILKERQSE